MIHVAVLVPIIHHHHHQFQLEGIVVVILAVVYQGNFSFLIIYILRLGWKKF